MSHNDPDSLPPDEPEQLPPALQAQLRALYQPSAGFPSARDALLLGRIRRRRALWPTRRWILSSAVAAALAITAGIALYLHSGAESRAFVRTGDIRDAFFLARQLKAHRLPAGNWDENRDGRVDQADVQVLALAAVRVERAGPTAEGGAR